MIVEQTDGHEPALVITPPLGDRIVAFVVLVGMGAFLAWHVYGLEKVDFWSLFISAGLLVNVLFLWERIVVCRKSVRRRVLRWRQVELPRNFTVERHGPLVRLREAESQFDYRFPKYMNHGRELERRLRIFFQQSDQVTLGSRAGSGDFDDPASDPR